LGTTTDITTPADDSSEETTEDTGTGTSDIRLPGTPSYATGNIWRTAQFNEWTTADFHMTTNDSVIPGNIYDTLVRIQANPDGTSEFIPSLATSWTVSDDGMLWTFTLRENVPFHNGEIFKADDVKFTFERMMNPDQHARWPTLLTMIVGAQAMLEGEASEIEGIRIINDYEIEIALTGPFAPFLSNMSFIGLCIYNRKATEEAGDEFGINPALTIGTGPFRYVTWELNDYHLLEAFDDYWGGRPQIDGILFRVIPDANAQMMLYEQGELDAIPLSTADAEHYLTTPWADHVRSLRGINIAYLHMNQAIEPFGDIRVRRAVQLALDRQAMLDSPATQGGNGEVNHGIIPRGLLGFNPDLPPIPFDQDEARRLLAEAGYPDGFEMELTQWPHSQADYMTYVNEIVMAQLAEVGIMATVRIMDVGTWGTIRTRGELASYNATWGASFNDPDYFFGTFFAPWTVRSFNVQRTDLLDRVAAAAFIVDPDERIREYQALEIALIQEEACWVPLYSMNTWNMVHTRLVDWEPGWAGDFGRAADYITVLP
jgi:ABC-type transport system substrate-binding protein